MSHFVCHTSLDFAYHCSSTPFNMAYSPTSSYIRIKLLAAYQRHSNMAEQVDLTLPFEIRLT
jgi:hypothetical protein